MISKITVRGNKFECNGTTWWCKGVNTPWQNWNDFGGDYREAFWKEHFQDLHENGVNCVRIWVNCDGKGAVKLTEEGSFKEVVESHWAHLDSLFDLAEEQQIYLMPTLFSFDHFQEPNEAHESWRKMLQNPDYMDSVVKGYVIPFARRYGDRNIMLGIDLMNEPDWVYENDRCGKIDWKYLSTFFAKAAAAIHENSQALVTVGIGIVKYNSDSAKCAGNKIADAYLKELSGKETAYVDFYSPHYYHWEKAQWGSPFDMDIHTFGMDDEKPAFLGEVAANDYEEGKLTLKEKYRKIRENGWQGLMAWTSNGVDKCGGLNDIVSAELKEWM